MESLISISETSDNKCLFVFIMSFFFSFGEFIYVQYVFDGNSNKKYLLELIIRRSKVHPKNTLQTLTNDNHFFDNYKPIRVCLCLLYKIPEINCRS